ncbi:unnamed protein product [Ectocarpus fasciculatus]
MEKYACEMLRTWLSIECGIDPTTCASNAPQPELEKQSERHQAQTPRTNDRFSVGLRITLERRRLLIHATAYDLGKSTPQQGSCHMAYSRVRRHGCVIQASKIARQKRCLTEDL